MKALIDTNPFLWAISADRRLSKHAGELFTSGNALWLSVASIWEILVKVRIGKLVLPIPAGPYLVKKLAENRIETLPVSLDHTLRLEMLPMHHRDPFDRLLISQSITEDWPVVTSDSMFNKYPVRVIW
jgi:PIN domain nuclease of toxin-antitoxin system